MPGAMGTAHASVRSFPLGTQPFNEDEWPQSGRSGQNSKSKHPRRAMHRGVYAFYTEKDEGQTDEKSAGGVRKGKPENAVSDCHKFP